MRVRLIILAAIIFALCIALVVFRVEHFADYLSHPTRCFTCEQQMLQEGNDAVYLAQPTKSFAAEQQAVALGCPFCGKSIKGV